MYVARTDPPPFRMSSSLRPMDDPYRVLMLNQADATVSTLNANFQKLLAQLHPSKCSLPRASAEEVRVLLYKSYEKVLDDVRDRDKKRVEPNVSRFLNENLQSSSGSEALKKKAHKFDMTRFNEIYDSNRAPSVYDKGYSEWMKGDFDANAPKSCDDISTKKNDPEPVTFLHGKGIGFSELGADDISDFGNVTEFSSGSLMKYADVRDAHSARNNLIDSRLEADFREKKKSYDDILAERSNANSLILTPAQKRALDERRRLAEATETAREKRLREQTEEATKRFDAVHSQMFAS